MHAIETRLHVAWPGWKLVVAPLCGFPLLCLCACSASKERRLDTAVLAQEAGPLPSDASLSGADASLPGPEDASLPRPSLSSSTVSNLDASEPATSPTKGLSRPAPDANSAPPADAQVPQASGDTATSDAETRFSQLVIDFETIPGASPANLLPISTQFQASHGVTFSLEPSGYPVLANVGEPEEAFGSDYGTDSTQPATDVGSWFLTDDGILDGLTAQVLRVDYAPPARAASGVVLDIDFGEVFTITAYATTGDVLEELVIRAGDPGTGDALATNWAFERPADDIASIRFAGARTQSGRFGLGFDNFNARKVLSTP
jgi:hypothetical protein